MTTSFRAWLIVVICSFIVLLFTAGKAQQVKHYQLSDIYTLPTPTWSGPVPSFCVIVRTTHKHKVSLWALMMSLLVNRPPKLAVYVVNTDKGGGFPELRQMVQHANRLTGIKIFHDMGAIVNNSAAQQALGPGFNVTSLQDFGYVLTDLVMEHILKVRDCEFMLVTNGDNLYGSDFFRAVVPPIQQGHNLVAVHFVTHHPRDGSRSHTCGPYRAGTDMEIETGFEIGCVDLGAAVFATNIVERLNIRFALNALRQNPQAGLYAADGITFMEMVKDINTRATVVHRVLMLHQ